VLQYVCSETKRRMPLWDRYSLFTWGASLQIYIWSMKLINNCVASAQCQICGILQIYWHVCSFSPRVLECLQGACWSG
jgi:hypothetical protein